MSLSRVSVPILQVMHTTNPCTATVQMEGVCEPVDAAVEELVVVHVHLDAMRIIDVVVISADVAVFNPNVTASNVVGLKPRI